MPSGEQVHKHVSSTLITLGGITFYLFSSVSICVSSPFYPLTVGSHRSRRICIGVHVCSLSLKHWKHFTIHLCWNVFTAESCYFAHTHLYARLSGRGLTTLNQSDSTCSMEIMLRCTQPCRFVYNIAHPHTHTQCWWSPRWRLGVSIWVVSWGNCLTNCMPIMIGMFAPSLLAPYLLCIYIYIYRCVSERTGSLSTHLSTNPSSVSWFSTYSATLIVSHIVSVSATRLTCLSFW